MTGSSSNRLLLVSVSLLSQNPRALRPEKHLLVLLLGVLPRSRAAATTAAPTAVAARSVGWRDSGPNVHVTLCFWMSHSLIIQWWTPIYSSLSLLKIFCVHVKGKWELGKWDLPVTLLVKVKPILMETCLPDAEGPSPAFPCRCCLGVLTTFSPGIFSLIHTAGAPEDTKPVRWTTRNLWWARLTCFQGEGQFRFWQRPEILGCQQKGSHKVRYVLRL